ncbi:MAG: O-antigen ligase family protein [Ruminococcus sp.]|nr:O-antigen ligase family protein [Ruminococcus sp.]
MADRKTEERKHLFGTTEKSDFILNMSQEQTYKLCGIYSMIAISVLLVINVMYTIAKHTFDYVEDGVTHYADDLFATYSSYLVIGAGLIGFWFFLVGRMKKEIVVKNNKPLVIPLLIIAVSAWSMFASGAISTAFFGYLDRSEGLLTILAYWGFFAAGMAVTGDKWRARFIDFLVCVGLVNAVMAILQSIPALHDAIPNKFKDLYVRAGTVAANDNEIVNIDGIYKKSYAATGFTITPHALAAVMTIIFALAAAGFVFEKSRKKKIFYGASSVLFAYTALLTKTITGPIGIASAAFAVLVIAAVKSGAKKQKAPLIIAACLAVAVAAGSAGLLVSETVIPEDEKIIYTDGFNHLSIGLPSRTDTKEWIYSYLWSDGAYAMQQHIITGTGPDNWSEMYTCGLTIDRSYNEYIDVGMQRGIFALVLHCLFLIVTFVKLVQAAIMHFRDEEKISWAALGFLSAFFAYLVQAFFNVSSNYSSAYFYLIAGIAWSYCAAKKYSKKTKQND